jgi:hypothetical protein
VQADTALAWGIEILRRWGNMKDVRAVSIIGGISCCQAARSLKGQRRLVLEGVALPLTACTMSSQCKCRYQKYADRREDDDRRSPGSTARAAQFGMSERRQAEGRRPADLR